MQKIIINTLGPIKYCELQIDEFMVFTGAQASGKSTIAKSIFFFKNIKNLLGMQLRRRYLLNGNVDYQELSVKNGLIREIRSNFLQTFGSTWCMDAGMSLTYYYTETKYIKISLMPDEIHSNYIWIDISEELSKQLSLLEVDNWTLLITNFDFPTIQKKINIIFEDDAEIIYIPAGRSMITLLSSQLNYIYSSMDDSQKRNLDYCTQSYLERILLLKPVFSVSIAELIKNKLQLTSEKVNKEVLLFCAELMKGILQGEYRNVDGEERLQVSEDRYVKINFASSGQQESVWILNVLFNALLNNKKTYFIIEEPESHLFPNAQKQMAEFIAVIKKYNQNQVLITTHSPYILGTINNLLYANKLSKYADCATLEKVISSKQWVEFDTFSAYFVKQGKVESCTDEAFESIENEVIDGASADINRDYEAMLEIRAKYQKDGE